MVDRNGKPVHVGTVLTDGTRTGEVIAKTRRAVFVQLCGAAWSTVVRLDRRDLPRRDGPWCVGGHDPTP